jgi:outer membrane receptor protein involved in Fe transport
LPDGSKQLFNTFMLRGNFRVTQKLNVQLVNYLNSYQSTYPAANGPNGTCKSGISATCIFDTTTHTHEDARASLEYRPTQSMAVRFSAGSAIAPPYLALLDAIPGLVTCQGTGCPYATQTVNAGTLKPETAFGYDLGADYRLPDGVTTFSGDLYMTNLFNHFISQTYPSGLTCNGAVQGGTCNNAPIFYTSNVNLNNARFEGIELSLRRRPAVGFGYTLQGDLEKAYAYNLPPYFYCSKGVNQPAKTKGGTPGCIPANYDQNLAIIAGQNFTGNAIGSGFNGFSNTNIPYATGYGELNYHFHGGSYALLGATYFGKNNSMFVPPFVTLNAGVGAMFNNGMELQLTGTNLTNKYNGLWPNFGGGLFVPLANGQMAASQANVLGPAVYHITLSKYFGSGFAPTP